MKPHLLIVCVILAIGVGRASAQTEQSPAQPLSRAASPAAETQALRVTMSFANMLDGNVSHSTAPIRSYGVVPSLEIHHERPNRTGWSWGYEIAAHHYTGTDEWDRISHNLETAVGYRITTRLRAETSAEANWKGSSDDRELANTFGLAERATYRVSASTRLSISGAYRYKAYGESPETSGPSPYIGAKFDQRLGGLRLTAGYKYQARLSHSVRDRYRRRAYGATIAAPLGSLSRISLDWEFRSQQYDREIRVAGRQVLRTDRRTIAELAYARAVSERTEVRWICGFESRRSNDPSKRFVDPTFGMTMGYRLR